MTPYSSHSFGFVAQSMLTTLLSRSVSCMEIHSGSSTLLRSLSLHQHPASPRMAGRLTVLAVCATRVRTAFSA